MIAWAVGGLFIALVFGMACRSFGIFLIIGVGFLAAQHYGWAPDWANDKDGMPAFIGSTATWFSDTWNSIGTWVHTWSKAITWWYLVGIPSALYWPMQYRAKIRKSQWKWMMATTPLFAILGPIALIARFPI